MVKLNKRFNEIDEQLKRKKEAFVQMYRKDPRISYDEKVSSLKQSLQFISESLIQNLAILRIRSLFDFVFKPPETLLHT